MTAYETAVAAAKAIDGKKGLNIQVIEIGDVSVIADYMVIASITSTCSSTCSPRRRGSFMTSTVYGRTASPLI